MNVHEVAVHVDQYSIAIWSKRKRWTKRGQKKSTQSMLRALKGIFMGGHPWIILNLQLSVVIQLLHDLL